MSIGQNQSSTGTGSKGTTLYSNLIMSPPASDCFSNDFEYSDLTEDLSDESESDVCVDYSNVIMD